MEHQPCPDIRALYTSISRAKTPAEVLGLSKNPVPTQSDAKKAYRRLALLLHPDKASTPGLATLHTSLFQKVQSAYEKLRKQLDNGFVVEGDGTDEMDETDIVFAALEESPLARHQRIWDFKVWLKAERAAALQCKLERPLKYDKRESVLRGGTSHVSRAEKEYRENNAAAQELRAEMAGEEIHPFDHVHAVFKSRHRKRRQQASQSPRASPNAAMAQALARDPDLASYVWTGSGAHGCTFADRIGRQNMPDELEGVESSEAPEDYGELGKRKLATMKASEIAEAWGSAHLGSSKTFRCPTVEEHKAEDGGAESSEVVAAEALGCAQSAAWAEAKVDAAELDASVAAHLGIFQFEPISRPKMKKFKPVDDWLAVAEDDVAGMEC